MSNALHRVPRLTLWLLLAAALLPANAQQVLPVPELTARVVDQTGTLTDAQRSNIEARLADFEKQHGSQIAVLLVQTTAPEDIAAYANRVASTWRLGRPGTGDGVLVVLAMRDRTVRIEVARALEGAITDVSAKRIIDEHMVPAFRAGDYSGGIVSAVNDLTGLIRGEALPAPRPRPSGKPRAPESRDQPSGTDVVSEYLVGLLVLTVALFAIPAFGAQLSSDLGLVFGHSGKAIIATVVGALGGATGYALCAMTGGLSPVAGSILAALGAVGLMLLMLRYLLPWFDRHSAGGGHGTGTGSWTGSYSGYGSSGDHDSSSSGSDGFSSGGGGSYGGGGASGKW